MTNIDEKLPLMRPSVEAMGPARYPPAAEDLRATGYTGTIRRLHLNESAIPPSPKVQEAIREASSAVHLYPDPKCRALMAVLAERVGLPAEQVICSNGSESLLQMACQLFLDRGKSVVIPEPSFPRYTMGATAMGADVIHVPLRADGAMDVKRTLEAILPNTAVVFAVSPNNPTGVMLSEAEIRDLARGVPNDVVLIFDEAYFEFARHAGGHDALEVLKTVRTGPWVLTRTLSKAYGIAGMRLGYAVCSSDEIADGLRQMTIVFPLNNIGIAAALAALADQPYADHLVSETIKERSRLSKGLRELGMEVLPSHANFVAAKMPLPAYPVVMALGKRGIMVSSIRSVYHGYENYIRVSIGSSEDTDALLAALKEELAKSS